MEKYCDLRIFSLEHGGIRSDAVQKERDIRYHSPSAWRLPFTQTDAPAFVMMNPELAGLIADINRKNIELLHLRRDIPQSAIDQFAVSSMIEEIQQTNEVEGVHSTRREIRDAVDAIQDPASGKRFLGMVRKYDMLIAQKEIPLKTGMDIRKLYDEFILDEVIREDPDNAPDGLIFRGGPIKVVSANGQVLHEGLFPETQIIEAMDQALMVLHNPEMDLLIRVAVFHYLFGYIHPFNDGNGRMTRFISSYMLSKLYDESACLRIAYVVKDHRAAYQNAFKNANDRRSMGDLTRFVIDFLRFFNLALDDAYATLKDKNNRYKQYLQALNAAMTLNIPNPDSSYQLMLRVMLQAELFGQPGYDIHQLAYLVEKSENTVRKMLNQCGNLVLSQKSGKKIQFRLRLDLLED